MTKQLPDLVNHPPHYTSGVIETIDYIEDRLGVEGFKSYLEGQVHKYLARFKQKGTAKQDLEKAKFYLKRLIERQ